MRSARCAALPQCAPGGQPPANLSGGWAFYQRNEDCESADRAPFARGHRTPRGVFSALRPGKPTVRQRSVRRESGERSSRCSVERARCPRFRRIDSEARRIDSDARRIDSDARRGALRRHRGAMLSRHDLRSIERVPRRHVSSLRRQSRVMLRSGNDVQRYPGLRRGHLHAVTATRSL
jgi:hypothetical protein